MLLAEDEQHTQLALSLVLRKAGYRVTVVGDGLQALRRTLDSSCGLDALDLLVLDIQMPNLSGLDLLHELERRDEPLPTLVISGYHYQQFVKNQTRAKLAYLEKPFEPREFLRHVRWLLETSCAEQPLLQDKGPDGPSEPHA